jgi:hypothetical protein
MLAIEIGPCLARLVSRRESVAVLSYFCGVVIATRRHLHDTRVDACSPHRGDKTWSDRPASSVQNIGLVRAVNRSEVNA